MIITEGKEAIKVVYIKLFVEFLFNLSHTLVLVNKCKGACLPHPGGGGAFQIFANPM
jgi:hypothetical protein